jgi:hypothetical protein
MQNSEKDMTPQEHAQHIAQVLGQAQQECRSNVERVNDPQARALFVTVAEVIGGAMKALQDYQQGNEKAWQAYSATTYAQHTTAAPKGTQPPVTPDTDTWVDISEDTPPKLFTE